MSKSLTQKKQPRGSKKPGPVDDFRNRVFCGDAIRILRKLPDNCVDCVVTSPPYYRQREYPSSFQIGQEDTAGDYVKNLTQVFDEIQRILKPEGTCWLNLGDKFVKGNLLGMPWRVALGLMENGWLLRNEIVWHKPNAMPSSARNRLTVDHETLFFFTRQNSYFYDADAIREPHVTFSEQSRMKGGRGHFGKRGGTPETGKNQGNNNLHDGRWDQAFHPQGRNKRTVWSIPLSKFREAHFAVFPESLVQNCLLAGSPKGGVVMDPFCGSGTVLKVASELDRDYVGIDCAAEYCRMARSRIKRSRK